MVNEDCLQLNVFVPRDVVTIGTGLPVMVFVPGGGFFGGSASSADGSIWLATAAALVSYFDRLVALTPQEPSFRIRPHSV
jgi:carboxylesterase type B